MKKVYRFLSNQMYFYTTIQKFFEWTSLSFGQTAPIMLSYLIQVHIYECNALNDCVNSG